MLAPTVWQTQQEEVTSVEPGSRLSSPPHHAPVAASDPPFPPPKNCRSAMDFLPSHLIPTGHFHASVCMSPSTNHTSFTWAPFPEAVLCPLNKLTPSWDQNFYMIFRSPPSLSPHVYSVTQICPFHLRKNPTLLLHWIFNFTIIIILCFYLFTKHQASHHAEEDTQPIFVN